MNSKIKIGAWVVAGLSAVFILLLFPRNSYNDPDTFWHIENGRFMIEHGLILHHAIHTFYGDALPFIPHEYGFELIESALYSTFGWPGTYLLTAASFGLLLIGLYRLMEVSRQESGLAGMPIACWILLALAGTWVYYGYFTSRPQMLSAFLIVWYFIWMRTYRSTREWRYGAAMALCSCALANVHAGVWPVIAVFSGMQIAESILERNGRLRDVAVYAATALAGLLNPSGYRSLFYVLAVTRNHYNRLINEWKPIDFMNWENIPIVLSLLFFAYVLPFSLNKKVFRCLLMLGIVYLGCSNFKQNLFLWLFLPYFAASAVDKAPIVRLMRIRFVLQPKTVMIGLSAGFMVNAVLVFLHPPALNAAAYPVDEMSYILARSNPREHPKVLAPYGSSGYVMFRGGDVLCDGRQDPFVTDASKGAYGWNAFERSMYGFSDRLPTIVKTDQPDYVIAQANAPAELMQQWEIAFGSPVYEGRYGRVFALSR